MVGNFLRVCSLSNKASSARQAWLGEVPSWEDGVRSGLVEGTHK